MVVKVFTNIFGHCGKFLGIFLGEAYQHKVMWYVRKSLNQKSESLWFFQLLLYVLEKLLFFLDLSFSICKIRGLDQTISKILYNGKNIEFRIRHILLHSFSKCFLKAILCQSLEILISTIKKLTNQFLWSLCSILVDNKKTNT